MCTAISFSSSEHFFGRTLDIECSFGEEVVITPRNFPLINANLSVNHYAIMGIAHVFENEPLFYDAVNEKGLCMAALNFVGNACYNPQKRDWDNIPCDRLISHLLGRCATVDEAVKNLEHINITAPENPNLPTPQLHWMIADKNRTVVLEITEKGVQIFDNPTGVLTNNPPFEMQLNRLCDYLDITPNPPQNLFGKELGLTPYSRGMGAMSLPGGNSSAARFVRAAFALKCSPEFETEAENISQFFHITETVSIVLGTTVTEDGKRDKTLYTSCINADKGIYYYTTYGRRSITAVDMSLQNLNGFELTRFPLKTEEKIELQNL